MGKLRITLLLILTALLSGQGAIAQRHTYIVHLSVVEYPEIENTPPGSRNQYPTEYTCTITEEGITFSSNCDEEITTYEIYDQRGHCLGIFNDPADFLTVLFSNHGTCEIRLQTDKSLLVGSLQI